MRILFATSEALPYWKTGGLADVARALPDVLLGRDHDVQLILPFYRGIRESGLPLEAAGEAVIPWPGGDLPVRYLLHRPARGASALLVDQPEFFETLQPYGAPDEDPLVTGTRFAFFSRAVVERARSGGVDVVHLNDWQTGLVPLYALLDGMPAASVMVVHNLAYQGNFAPEILDAVGVPNAFKRPENRQDFYGRASFLKAGLALADRLVTVSPTYAAEIQTPAVGAGLDGLLRFRHRLLHGVLNGIDGELWNPGSDGELATCYDARSLAAKERNRTELLRDLELDDGGPLLVLVSRLAYQKGIDLLLDVLPEVLGLGASLSVLGDGEPSYEDAVRRAAAAHPGRVAVDIGFDDALAHRLYAGGDFLVMPSRYEPCGLGQMIAQRYGTPPIVHRTGGLADTVEDRQTGFTFERAEPRALLQAVRRAVRAWRGARWNALRRRCMVVDRSWDPSATRYEAIYRLAIGKLPDET